MAVSARPPPRPLNIELRARRRLWAVLILSVTLHALLLGINVQFPEAREWQPPPTALQVALVTLEPPTAPDAPQPDTHAETSPSASAVSPPSPNPQIEHLRPVAANPKARSIKRTLSKLTAEPKLPPAKTLASAPAEPVSRERTEVASSDIKSGIVTDLSATDLGAGRDESGETAQPVPEYRLAGGMDGPEKDSSPAALEPDVGAPPVYLVTPRPPYPGRSLAVGEQGTVLVATLVGTDGKVKEANLEHSSGYPLLDSSALATVREKWVFKPALLAGKLVESWVRVPVEFRIHSR